MLEDIHNEEEPFRKAYGQMEEEPSPEVWEKINAHLDGQDAAYYRKRSVTWKRIACLLLLLLGTTVLYEVYISKEHGITSANNQSKTASDRYRSDSVRQQATEADAAHPGAGKSIDTNTSLQNDWSNRVAAGEVHTRHHNQQSLSAQDNRAYTDEVSVVQPETKAHSSNGQSLLKNDSQPRFTLEQHTYHASDSDYHVQLHTESLAADNTGKKNREGIADSTKIQVLSERDSIHAIALSADSAGRSRFTASSAAKATVRFHKSAAGSWTVTPFISADVTGYALDDDNQHDRGSGNQPEHHKQEIEQRETHQFSFSAGAFARWQFTPKVSFSTGLVYSNISIGIQPQTLYASKDNNQGISYKFITSSGYAYVKPVFSSSPTSGDSITAKISHHHLQYLAVPFTVGYTLNANKRLSVTPGLGLSANILLSTKVRTEVNEDTNQEIIVINKLQGLRKTYFSFLADADINYSLNRRLSLSLIPMFRYAINPITKENVVNTFPYSLSIDAGVTYSF